MRANAVDPACWSLPYREDCRVYYAGIRDLDWPAWLDSGRPHSPDGRYDIIVADPWATLRLSDGRLLVQPPGLLSDGTTQPLELLRSLIGVPLAAGDLPFAGGAVGFLGYDLARDLGLLGARPGLTGWPHMAVGIYDWALVVDHLHARAWFVRGGRDPRDGRHWQDALVRLRAAAERTPGEPMRVHAELLEPGMAYRDYAAAFARIQRYIRDGDCYQVNLAQRFRARVADDAWTLYQRMRSANPAPYGALLEYPFGQVLSCSPEQFLAVREGQVLTRPIKGTRPRGDNAAADAAMREALRGSAKDRAENLMIVDLLRNDLGRVCAPGSIAVPELFAVESFATVHHLVSSVTGRLASGHDAIDLLTAAFPGGSVTGAPKRRAMQIIDQLEPLRREVYCGSVFRLGYDGNLDSNITIRTALLRDADLYYWAGGGIVADSSCADEYRESIDKAAAFLRLTGQSLASFQCS